MEECLPLLYGFIIPSPVWIHYEVLFLFMFKWDSNVIYVVVVDE